MDTQAYFIDAFDSLPEGRVAHLIGNLIVLEPPPSYAHQDISASLGFALYEFASRKGLGKVLFAPIGVYLDAENAFQPDILFVSRERMHIIQEKGLFGAPDLIVEILSPSTARYDRKGKMRVYERHGVKEYWLVNPNTRGVQGYRLIEGAFEAFPAAEGIVFSPLLGGTFKF